MKTKKANVSFVYKVVDNEGNQIDKEEVKYIAYIVENIAEENSCLLILNKDISTLKENINEYNEEKICKLLYPDMVDAKLIENFYLSISEEEANEEVIQKFEELSNSKVEVDKMIADIKSLEKKFSALQYDFIKSLYNDQSSSIFINEKELNAT